MPTFDPAVHFLGKLCKHGHEYGQTGKSLRYSRDKSCPTCNIIRNTKRLYTNPNSREHYNAYHRAYMARKRAERKAEKG